MFLNEPDLIYLHTVKWFQNSRSEAWGYYPSVKIQSSYSTASPTNDLTGLKGEY